MESDRSIPELKARIRQLERQIEGLQAIARSQRNWRDKFRPTLHTLDQYPARTWSVPPRYLATGLPRHPPSIAIVTPSLNQGAYIERTVRSVLAQDYPALRYTAQDGGSTDDTHSILRQFDGRLSWVSERDDGQSHAINLGFARIDGDIMAWLNSDDLLLPGTLAYVAQFFCDHPDIDVVYGHRICIDRHDNEIGRIILPRHDRETIKWLDYIPQETMFWRRRVWDSLGGLDQSFEFAVDWDFILRAHAAGFRFCRLPRFLGLFRVHDAQKTSLNEDICGRESNLLRERYLGRHVTPAEIKSATNAYLLRHVLTVRAYKLRLFRY